MYLGIPTQKSCARAWVAAAAALIEAGDAAFNVVIDVASPDLHDSTDNEIITLNDRFLRDHDVQPIVSVANTIFPQSLYNGFGSPEFYDEYHRNFDRLARRGWGRYFERMTRHKIAGGRTYNPLQDMVEKLRKQTDKRTYSSAYELAVYDPSRDGRYFRGGPCLSFLSFKVNAERKLNLTVMYRNHAYITRCLGNLIGLGRLQSFVAIEAGFGLGSLTCISTHASVDTGKGWGINDARRLVGEAVEIVDASNQFVELDHRSITLNR
jgi:hypothetical protein